MKENVIFLIGAGICLIEMIIAWRFPKVFRYSQETVIGICLVVLIIFLIAGILA